MKESDYKNVLAAQQRELQIMMITEKHPVYKDFIFTRYSNQKIAEMFKILVADHHQGGRNQTEAQTKV